MACAVVSIVELIAALNREELEAVLSGSKIRYEIIDRHPTELTTKAKPNHCPVKVVGVLALLIDECAQSRPVAIRG